MEKINVYFVRCQGGAAIVVGRYPMDAHRALENLALDWEDYKQGEVATVWEGAEPLPKSFVLWESGAK